MTGMAVWREDYILVEHEHVSEVADVIARIDGCKALIERGAPHRILVDGRHFRQAWAPAESDRIVEYALKNLPDSIRIAMLQNPDIPPQSSRFVDGMEKAGRAVSVFRSEAEALSWLRQA